MSVSDPTGSALGSLDRATVWLSSEPLTAQALRGRVVLVDFWTYSCVNWLRTLPYVRAWAERYADRGLVVVGVHAPEFGFEHDLDNVRRATAELGVAYPVVIDNDFAIWRSFDNHYWPAVYLVDGDGRVRFRHFGEEAYEETERAIQQLLGIEEQLVRVDAGGRAAPADWDTLGSPETYVGDLRGERRSDRSADALALNQWALDGDWTVGDEAAVLETAGGSIAYRFAGRDLNLVLAPPAAGGAARCAVLLDGQPPGGDHGLDVDESGAGAVAEPRLYQLVRQRGPVRERTFEIAFLGPGVRAYVFTFGSRRGAGAPRWRSREATRMSHTRIAERTGRFRPQRRKGRFSYRARKRRKRCLVLGKGRHHGRPPPHLHAEGALSHAPPACSTSV